MTKKLLRLYKVERYALDYVLAEDAAEAENTDFDSECSATATEVTAMTPWEEGYSWFPLDAKTGDWIDEKCGEWLERTAEQRRQEEDKERLIESALNKLSEEERTVLSEMLSYRLNTK